MPQKLAPFAPTGQNLAIHLTAATGAVTRAPVIRSGITPGANAGVSTTSSTAVTGGQANTVTPAAMTNIFVGSILQVSGGTGTPEEVVVTAITGTTFTANFANNHSGTYNIADRGRGHWLHAVTINAVGTGMTLTLYNGNPAFTWGSPAPLGSGVLAVITPVAGASYLFDLDCDLDLWYSYTGTTPGDVTISYQPKP